MTDRISNSAEETKQIAAQVAAQFKNHGGIIALVGDLGAGKTTFAQGFAQELGITEKIISPTFVLIRQHQVPNSNGKISEKMLFHIDLYRLEGEIHSKDLGLQEMFDNPENVILIEWAEKIASFLPKSVLTVKFEKTGEHIRKISWV